jgi:hypothetical protein
MPVVWYCVSLFTRIFRSESITMNYDGVFYSRKYELKIENTERSHVDPFWPLAAKAPMWAIIHSLLYKLLTDTLGRIFH